MSTLSNARRPLATAHRMIREGDTKAFRGYLHNLYETDRFGLAEAGEMLYEYTCKYGADFAKSLLETAKPNTESLSLVRFLSDHFFPRFQLNTEHRRLLQRVYLLHKNLAVDTYEVLRTQVSGEIAYNACCSYADFQDTGSAVGRLSVIAARSRATEIMEALAKQSHDHALLLNLADAYRGMTAYHLEGRDAKNLDAAMQYSRKALELSRRLYCEMPDRSTQALLASCKEDAAEVLRKTPMRKQAEALYKKALELRKAAAESDETDRLPYGLVCGRLAALYTETRGSDKREQATALYETEAELLRALGADIDPALQREYALCRMALGDLYAESDKVKDCITAFDHYKAASALQMRQLTASPTEQTALEYAESRYRMALTLWRVGGENNLNTALHIIEELTALQKEYPALKTLDGRLTFLTYALEDRLWIRHPLERSHPEFHPMYAHAYGCGEIMEILGYLPQSYREQLTCREQTALRLDALPFYKKHIDPAVPLKQQELSKTAADWVAGFISRCK